MLELPTVNSDSLDKKYSSLSQEEIYIRLAKSEYGEKLLGEVRFGWYKPEGMSNNKWKLLLGADVNNQQHMKLTDGLLSVFLEKYQEDAERMYTEGEKDLLHKTALSHDIGESIDGDIPFGEKTHAHEKKEIQAYRLIFHEVFGDEIDQELVNAMISVMTVEGHPLWKTFNMIERIGYLRTAIRSWEQAKSLSEYYINRQSPLISRLQWLTSNVLFHQIPKLITYSKELPAVRLYLGNQSRVISEAFTSMDNSAFTFNSDDINKSDKQKFEDAKKLWYESIGRVVKISDSSFTEGEVA